MTEISKMIYNVQFGNLNIIELKLLLKEVKKQIKSLENTEQGE